ncbi:MAG: hypothetical protein I8H77_05890 [Comamonadaceae bacterium]|nr:hypothetical protein [Comamonadaceae bacterium]
MRKLLMAIVFMVSWGSGVAAVSPMPLAWIQQVQVVYGQDGTELKVRGKASADFAGFFKLESERADIAIENFSEKVQSSGESEFEFILKSPMFKRGGYFIIPLKVKYEGQYHALTLKSGGEFAAHISLTKPRHWMVLAVVLLVIGLGFTPRFQKFCGMLGEWVERSQRKIVAGMLFVGLVLVVSGITGSSWKLWAKSAAGSSFFEVTGSDWTSRPHQIDRWDEWAVITPAVLAQLHHEPKFPVVNTNIGPEGQNMGVVGMFGVPIAQFAAVARPATWGYFVLPFRQAMAWQWQIQFWGCLLAVWWLLNIIGGAHAGRNLALALAFCSAPYAAGWSNWSLYASLFPVLGVCLLTVLLRTKAVAKAIFLGVALGWVLSSWVLVLYPPWLVIMGSLCAFLALGWMVDHRSEITWGPGQWLALLCVIATAGGLLGSWWIDTRDAVAQMQATVYPGGRQAELGGSASLIWFLRGYLGMESFANADGLGSGANRPELSSYFFVPIAMVAVLLLGVFRSPRLRATWLTLTAFTAIYFYYSFVGFPLWLAQTTKWGVLTTNRMDVGLGLTVMVLASMLWPHSSMAAPGVVQQKTRLVYSLIGGSLALASGALAWWVLSNVSPMLVPHNSLPYRLAITLMCAVIAWWMCNRQTVGLTLALLVMTLGAGFSYTPMSQAPLSISLAPAVKAFVTKVDKSELARTLVVDEASLPATTLAALGVPVINGALYYPHQSMWRSMQLPDDSWSVVNRYQHLTFVPARKPVGWLHYRATTPVMDAVTVHFDPKAFDFSMTGAERVVSHKTLSSLMAENPHLEKIGEYREYVWFSVK